MNILKDLLDIHEPKFSVVRSTLYIGTCTAIMIILDNKIELTKQFSWWIGWVMAVIYTNWVLKRR